MLSRTLILIGLAALPVPAAALAQQEGASSDQVPEGLPSLGRSALVRELSGDVYVRTGRNGRYRALDRRIRAIPMGSFVDARRGTVLVTVQARRDSERTSSARFYGGKFQITQSPDPPYVADMRLAGGFTERCRASDDEATTSARRRKKRRVRRLWGDGKGRFRTSGRYSAATVRGTRWLVEDRCDGTLTRVARGEVEVEDYSDGDAPEATPAPPPDSGGQAPAAAPDSRSGRRVRLRRGGSYYARPGR